MTYCAQCGAERPATAAFCGKCGTPRGAATSQTDQVAEPAASMSAENAGGFVPSRVITTFVLALFLPVVAVFMAYSGKREARAAGPTADALNRIAFVVSLVSSAALALYLLVFMGAIMVAATFTSNYNGY